VNNGVSQKRVDIEITGSAEKFKKAADDVQKKLDKINDAVNDIGDNDSVDKFARKFQRVGSYIEEVKDRLGDGANKDYFDQLTKDVKEFAEQLKKGEIKLEDFADEVKALEKLNLYKLAESCKDAMKNMKELAEENKKLNNQFDRYYGSDEFFDKFRFLGDNKVLFDRDMFTALRKEFDKIEDATEDAIKDVMKLTDEAEEVNRVQFNHIMDEIEKLTKITNDLNNPLKDIKELMKELDGKDIDDLNKEFKDIEATSTRLAKTMLSVSKAAKDFSNKFGKDIKDNKFSLQGFEEELCDLVLVLSEIRKRTGDTSDRMIKMFKDITESVENTTKETKDLNKEIKDVDKKPIEDVGETAKDTGKHIENMTDEVKDLNKETKDIDDTRFRDLSEGAKDADTHIDDMADSIDKADREMRDMSISKFKENLDVIRQYREELEQVINKYKELGDAVNDTHKKISGLGDLGKININGSSDKGSNSFMDNVISGTTEAIIVGKTLENTFEGIADATEKTTKAVSEVGEELKDISMQWKNLTNPDTEWADNFNFADKEQIQAIKQYLKDIKELEDEYAELEKQCSKLTEEQQQMIRSYLDGDTASSELDDSIKDLALSMNKVRSETEAYKEDNKHIALTLKNLDKIMVDSVESYEKIKQEVIDFIKSNKGAAASNKYVAESFMKLHNSMKEVYADIKPLPDDILEQLNKEAKELKESFDLISTEQIMKQLERMGKIIDDTTEKTKEFKQLNKEGWGTKNAANNIVDSMKDMQGFADNMAACVEKVGDGFVFLGDRVKKTNKEFDTNKINEYMDALNDYVKFLRDTGGQVSKSFADESGQLDVQKFFKAFEQFGRPLNQINAELQKNKTQILESLKAQKEHREELQRSADAARENAKAIRDNAKAQLKSAEAAAKAAKESGTEEEITKATKEVADAKERLAKAEKEYAEAADKAKNIDKQRVQDAKDLVKAFNEQAEAARKLGSNIKDITKNDISSFDSSLGSLLDADKIFPDDLPKKFSDFKEDFKAIKADLENFDLGGAGDNLKNIIAGVLDMIPGKAKLAAIAIAGIGIAMKECAEIGINQFSRGMDTIGNVVGKITGAARDVGSEIRDAFENLSGMDLDLGSLMEIPVEFEATMYQVGAITGELLDGATEDYQKLIDKARELGGTTRYSATEVAEAMVFLGQSGWEAQHMMEGLDSVLHLATIENMSLADSASFLSDALNTMNMETYEAADAADMLVATSISANTSVAQLKNAYNNAASTAATLGVSMSDLNVALGVMADKGIKGAKAGTALKNLMANMSAPTEKQLEYIKEFNLEGAQAAITEGRLIDGIKEMQNVMNNWKGPGALEGLTAKQKAAIITTIAGKEALSGVAALLNTTEADINKLKFAVDSSTKSSKLYAQSLGLVDGAGKMVAESFEEMTTEQADAYKKWEAFNKIMNETDEVGNSLVDVMQLVGGSASDLGAIIHRLAEDGSVTKEQVEEIINVFDKLQNSSEETTKVLQDYGIEVKKSDDGSLDFGETLKNLGAKWDTLTDTQKTNLAGQLGISGSIEELNELFSDNGEQIETLIDQYEKAKGVAEHVAETFDTAFKGSILNLASAIEERLLQVFDKFKPAIQGVTDELTEFFNIWNGMGQGEGRENLTGIADAMAYLKEVSVGWGKAIAESIEKGIGTINELVSGTVLDDMLQVGTNIIDGISRGIKAAAEDGTLQNAITTAINKIGTWFSNNLETVIEIGRTIIEAITQGIEDNSDLIGDIIGQVMEMQTEIDTTIAREKWKLIGENLWSFIGEGIMSKAKTFFAGLGGFLEGAADWMNPKIKDPDTGKEMMYIPDYTGMTGGTWIETGEKANNKNSKDTKKKNTKKTTVTDEVTKQMKEGKVNTDKAAAEIGQGISDNILKKLETMDAGELSGLRTEMESLQKTIETVASSLGKSFGLIREHARTEIVGMTNIFRNQFVNVTNITRNQMVNVSNIIRNQALNWSNIFKNQMKNSRDEVTRQMLSMASVTRTQMTNISNIIRNQSKSARDALTSQFISMAKVVSTQMKNCLSSVKSYMSQIKTQTSKTMTLNVKASTPSYTPATVSSAGALYAANAASAYSIGNSGNMSALSSRASSVSSTIGSSSYTSGASHNDLLLEIPLVVDGRELARSSAKYINGELKILSKRNDRKRGVK
jgi:TP901 family phage tail tape measure protein